jgi:hypothetical protein
VIETICGVQRSIRAYYSRRNLHEEKQKLRRIENMENRRMVKIGESSTHKSKY